VKDPDRQVLALLTEYRAHFLLNHRARTMMWVHNFLANLKQATTLPFELCSRKGRRCDYRRLNIA
jgi:hypothetical protein